MDLGGAWQAVEADDRLRRRFPDPDLDDDGWEPVPVPGHWRSVPAFSHSDGPLFYRRRFEAEPLPPGRRRWLDFDGLFYQGDAWLDGSYLGDTEGYFLPHRFEVTEALAARREHLLALELACAPPTDRRNKRSLTGVFQHWDCIDPAWNPGGIWAPVRVVDTGPVRILTLRITCRDATSEQATLEVMAVLDAAEAVTVGLTTAVDPVGLTTTVDPVGLTTASDSAGRPERHLLPGAAGHREAEETLAAGINRVRWRVTVDHPRLWWPHALGDQPRYEAVVAVTVGDEVSDTHRLTTGLRQIRMRNFVTSVNGERLFLKGANYGPTTRALGEATPEEIGADVDRARAAGLDLLRVHAHIARPELYDAADRAGVLLWQDLPLQWGYKGVRREAMRQARAAVNLLGHHPAIAVWCGHNEPLAVDVAPDGAVDGRTAARFVAGQLLPTWNKTRLDSSIKRALERSDGSRPVVAHSGVLPHPSGGTDTHLYFGWYHGELDGLPTLLARLPVLARFVSEFGAQAVPDTDDFLEPGRWPNLDWDRLVSAHSLQKHVFDERIPPAAYPSLIAWRRATQDYQAHVIRYHVETLRRLKYRPTGGFCQFMLADAQPGVTWAVLDHRRVPKSGYHALAQACAPVIVVAEPLKAVYRPGDRVALAIHAVSDLRVPLTDVVATARLTWPGGMRSWRFGGEVPADSCVRVGKVVTTLPGAGESGGTVTLDLELEWSDASSPGGARVTNRYRSELRSGPASPRATKH